MTELFLKIVNMSISASWLVLAVLFLRLTFKNTPKWANVLLWGIVAIRLVCPFFIESQFSLIPSAQTISPEIMMNHTPEITTGISVLNSVINPVISNSFTPTPDDSVNPLQIWVPVFAEIWMIGVGVLLAYTAISYWRLHRKIDTAVVIRDNIFQSENVGSPFVLGVVRPKIYLPYTMDRQNMEHVIAHEQAHIRRRDHWWKPFGFLLLTIHWFNPLVWTAYVFLCRDIELACDEKVIKELGSGQRADYTQALVACSVKRHMIAACPLAFGEVGVKERVMSVMNYKKPAFWIILLAVIICLIVAVCFLTNPPDILTPEPVMDSLTAEQVQWAQITLWGDETAHILLTEEQIKELVDILNDLEENDFIQSNVHDYDVSAMIYCGEKEILLHWDGEYTEFVFDSATAENIDDSYCCVRNQALNTILSKVSGKIIPAIQWFDYYNNPDDMNWSGRQEINVDAYPDITIRWYPERLEAVDNDGSQITALFYGMPIWNTFFADLTGDGFPEICSTVSFGSGIIDTHVVVYDYVESKEYTLWERGEYDYALRLENSNLICDKRVYPGGETVASGTLMLADILDTHEKTLIIVPSEDISLTNSTTEIVPGTTYVSYQCLYMNPLSSYMAFGGDSGCKYIAGEDYFATVYRSSGAQDMIDVPEWKWKAFPYSDEEWSAMYKPGGFGAIEEISKHFDKMLYHPLTSEEFLLQMDGDLWLVELSSDSQMGTYLWSIYKLVPESAMGTAQWEYRPAISSQYPAFGFSFNMDYTCITAACAEGTLISFDEPSATGYPSGNTLEVPAGCSLYWSPSDGSGTVVSQGKILVTIHLEDQTQYNCTIFITSSDNSEPWKHIYTASIIGAGVYMEQNPLQTGAVISTTDTD